MSAANTFDVDTTVQDLLRTFSFGADCRVEFFLPDAAESLRSKVQPLVCSLTAVNGQVVMDSGELKTLLLTTVAQGARSGAAPAGTDTNIRVTFRRCDEFSTKVSIEDSVTCNGAISKVQVPSTAGMKELMDDISGDTPSVPMENVKDVMRQSFRRSIANSVHGSPSAPSHLPSAAGSAAGSLTAAIPKAAERKESTKSHLPAAPGSSTRVSRAHTSETPEKDGDHSDSEGSVASSADFNTIRMGQLDGDLVSATIGVHAGADSPTPGLLEFDQMKLSMRIDDARGLGRSVAGDAGEATMKSKLRQALDNVKPGRCVICVTQEINPIAEIELLALASKKRVVALDLGVKLRLRPRPEQFAAQLGEAMRSGAWFVIVNAHKSISTCLLLDELLGDANQHELKGVDPSSRIVVSLEPHPHFPRNLIHDAVVIKLVSAFQGSSLMSDSLATSISRARLVTADTLNQSQILGSMKRASMSMGPTAAPAVQKPRKKHVRISAAVDIVDIAPREVVKSTGQDRPIDVSGSVALIKTFSGVDNDKFLCVRYAGERGRFAVGSSCGNVYFLDSLGNSLLQAHAHAGSIWDVSFNDKFHFATGCEDGTSAAWTLGNADGASEDDDAVLVPTAATSLGSDVYCVSYLKNMNPSPLVIGGLHTNLVIREAGGDNVHLVPIPSNAQVVDCLPTSSTALVGGGDGSVCVVDVATARALGTLVEHTRKLPALTVRDDNQFFTGSFDSSILSWDLRVPGGVTGTAQQSGAAAAGVTGHTMHTLKLKNYVTGLDADGVHLAASVGENLYLWDVRKLNTVLGGYPQGWKGLSRGIKVESESHLVVTASPDSLVRFWNFV